MRGPFEEEANALYCDPEVEPNLYRPGINNDRITSEVALCFCRTGQL